MKENFQIRPYISEVAPGICLYLFFNKTSSHEGTLMQSPHIVFYSIVGQCPYLVSQSGNKEMLSGVRLNFAQKYRFLIRIAEMSPVKMPFLMLFICLLPPSTSVLPKEFSILIAEKG